MHSVFSDNTANGSGEREMEKETGIVSSIKVGSGRQEQNLGCKRWVVQTVEGMDIGTFYN